jgi:16S rRNA processing protein RimM
VSADRVMVGVIVGAHGIKGAVRVKSFTAEPEGVAGYGPVEDEKGARRFELRPIGQAKGSVLAKIAGIEDRNAAEALKGVRLYVNRSALPPPEEEEFYHADLLGLEAVLGDGTVLGRVRAVHDFGAGDSLEIERTAAASLLVPFTKAAVPVVDIAGRRVVIEPPEGLLDGPSPPPLAGEGREGAAAAHSDASAFAGTSPPPASPRKRGEEKRGT